MLGQTLVGSRLRDVRSVLRHLRNPAPDLDAGRFGLVGDSFAPTNPAGSAMAVPLDAEPFPHQAEPLGSLLALFTALFEDESAPSTCVAGRPASSRSCRARSSTTRTTP